MPDCRAGVLTGNTLVRDAATSLAHQLGLPLADAPADDWCCYLFHSGDAPERLRLHLRLTGKHAPGPIDADFTHGRYRHRLTQGGERRQPLLRAIGLKPGLTPDVIDATAGLGRDAFVIATAGCRVRMLERSPLVAALLANGLALAAHEHDTAPIAARMQLLVTDATCYLDSLPADEWPDTIYLDPMFPARDKSALVKKEMQILQRLLGEDRDGATLLDIARRRCRRRVVVKRPRHAAFLADEPTTMQVFGKKTRYDIYPAEQDPAQ